MIFLNRFLGHLYVNCAVYIGLCDFKYFKWVEILEMMDSMKKWGENNNHLILWTVLSKIDLLFSLKKKN